MVIYSNRSGKSTSSFRFTQSHGSSGVSSEALLDLVTPESSKAMTFPIYTERNKL